MSHSDTPNLDGPFTLAGWAYDPVLDVWRPRAECATAWRYEFDGANSGPERKIGCAEAPRTGSWEDQLDRVWDKLNRAWEYPVSAEPPRRTYEWKYDVGTGGMRLYEITTADDPTPPATDVDRVIDQLDRRVVGDRDRGRLRDAVDRADKPLGGKAGADQAVGKALRL